MKRNLIITLLAVLLLCLGVSCSYGDETVAKKTIQIYHIGKTDSPVLEFEVYENSTMTWSDYKYTTSFSYNGLAIYTSWPGDIVVFRSLVYDNTYSEHWLYYYNNKGVLTTVEPEALITKYEKMYTK